MPVVRQRIPRAVTVLHSRSALAIVPAFLSISTPYFHRSLAFYDLNSVMSLILVSRSNPISILDDDSVEHQVRSTRIHFFEAPMLSIILF
jgi:hypothetical protein